LRMEGGHVGWADPVDADARHNANQQNGLVFSTMICPSSPLEALGDVGRGFKGTQPQYIGIAGAANGNGFTNAGNHPQYGCCSCCSGNTRNGVASNGGVLIRVRGVGVRDITDGTSQTLMVGECSDFARTSTGAPVKINNHHGWLMGTSRSNQNGNERAFNITTIRYPPNAVKENGGTGLRGVGNNDGSNNGVYSAHVGIVQVTLADGSTRALNENMDMRILRLLATRDDGEIVGQF
jgi:hypothetical protein